MHDVAIAPRPRRFSFRVEERRAWIRSHTVVLDGEAEFDRFAHDPSGSQLRLLRVWLVDDSGHPCAPPAYLGVVRLFSDWPTGDDLDALVRRAARLAAFRGLRLAEVRLQVECALRRHLAPA